MSNKNINLKLGNIELRKYKGWNDPELDGDISDKYEFIKWENVNDKEYCYVVAFATPTNEGYDIRTVGSRPWDLEGEDFDNYNKLVSMFFNIADLMK